MAVLSSFRAVVFIAVACCWLTHVSAQTKSGAGKITNINGNQFEMTEARYDTQILVNPVTEEEEMRISCTAPRPVKMNAELIVTRPEMPPILAASGKSLQRYLYAGLQPYLEELNDGAYYLDLTDVLVDATGKIVYYNFNGLQTWNARNVSDNKPVPKVILDASLRKKINNTVETLLKNAPAYTPATHHGKKVLAFAHPDFMSNFIQVKAHQVMLTSADAIDR